MLANRKYYLSDNLNFYKKLKYIVELGTSQIFYLVNRSSSLNRLLHSESSNHIMLYIPQTKDWATQNYNVRDIKQGDKW